MDFRFGRRVRELVADIVSEIQWEEAFCDKGYESPFGREDDQ